MTSSLTPIIYFSGLDRSGKSTTRKEFAVKTNQKYFTWDRSFVDNIVYDEAFRNIRLSELEIKEVIERFTNAKNVYIVHMVLSIEEVNRRTKVSEGSEYPVNELLLCSKLFYKYFQYASHYGAKVIRVECDNKTVDEIVSEIVTTIEGVTK